MDSLNRHIVMRCSWDTRFDAKASATSFQNTISQWSKHQLEKEMNAVFDDVCVAGQTLKIDTLELNLGIIAYDEFMQVLPKLFRNALRQQLQDLLNYPQKNGNVLEIIQEDTSYIKMLQNFLLQGVMPWNYHLNFGSVNDILAAQIANNGVEVLQMIQQVGKHEYVRKRMAWQFKEPNLKSIIKKLEPNHHKEIFTFTGEFIKIQEKETIIQTSSKDLKRNIWFWILNYLFTERGTMFNKIAFVRSNITQMANHFNIEYHFLLRMIQNAISKAKKASYVRSDFISILTILSNEKHHQKLSKKALKQQDKVFWKQLESYLLKPSERSTSTAKNNFNALILGLLKHNPSRFRTLVLNVAKRITNWETVFKDLKQPAIAVLFSSVASTKGATMLKQLHFLNEMKIAKHFKVKKVQVLAIGFQFAIQTHLNTTKSASLVAFVIKALGNVNDVATQKVLEELIYTDNTFIKKTITHIPVFKELNAMYLDEVVSKKSTLNADTLQEVIAVIGHWSGYVQNDAKTIAKYQQLFKQWIRKDPVKTWKYLVLHNQPEAITTMLGSVLNPSEINVFLEQTNSIYIKLVYQFEAAIDVLLQKNTTLGTQLRQIKTHLYTSSLRVLLTAQYSSNQDFIIALFKKIQTLDGIRETKLFREVFEVLIKHSKFRHYPLFLEAYRKTIAFEDRLKEITTIAEVKRIMTQQADAQQLVIHALKTNAFVVSKLSEATIVSIQNYVLRDNTISFQQLIKNYLSRIQESSTISSTKTSLQKQLYSLYWKAILQYEDYKGNTSKFLVVLEELICFTFPALAKVKIEAKQQKNIPVDGYNDTSYYINQQFISESKLFYWLETVLKNKKKLVTYKKQQFTIQQLLVWSLEVNAKRCKALIKKYSNDKNCFNIIKSSIEFKQFIYLLNSDLSIGEKRYFSDIITLYDVVRKLDNQHYIAAILPSFWNYTHLIIQSTSASESKKYLQQLVAHIFKHLAASNEISTAHIFNIILQQNIQFSSSLKAAFISHNKAFNHIQQQTQTTSTIRKALQACVQQNRGEVLCMYLMIHLKVPQWFQYNTNYSVSAVIHEILREQPTLFVSILRTRKITDNQLARCIQEVNYVILIDSLIKLYPMQQKQLLVLKQLFRLFQGITQQGITATLLSTICIQKILKAWSTSNWEIIASTRIWNELLWEVTTKHNISKTDFFAAVEQIKIGLPTSLLIGFESIRPKAIKKLQIEAQYEEKNIKAVHMEETQSQLPKEGITVPNAGIVLLNSYYLMLFERLGLVNEKKFITTQAQHEAVHYLQYIVTGLSQTEESLLPLNKVLCGLATSTPIQDSIEIAAQDKQLIDGLITSAISYWTAIGDTSINGFRGNWLVREGILREEEERWELTVEKRAYDILMMKSPFSFSIIKLPWMDKPLHVTWPY